MSVVRRGKENINISLYSSSPLLLSWNLPVHKMRKKDVLRFRICVAFGEGPELTKEGAMRWWILSGILLLALAGCANDGGDGGDGNGGSTTQTIELTVNGAPVTNSLTAGSSSLYFFSHVDTGTLMTYTVTTTITSGDVDLDLCGYSSCTWGNGIISSSNTGTTTETISITPTISWDYYVNVQAILDSNYTISVTTGGDGSAPAAPTGVSASPGDGQVTISWSAVTDADSYNLYWSTTSGVTKTSGTQISGATPLYS
jgi:hypothetical protein